MDAASADLGLGLGSGFGAGLAGWLAEVVSLWLELLSDARRPIAFALAILLACTALEQLFPAEPGQGLRGRLRNLAYYAQLEVLGFAGLAVWIHDGPILVRSAHAPSGLELALVVAANLFAIDFAYYWYHRAQHRIPALWAIHELHHADAELNATSSFRTYWLEMPVQAVIVVAPSLLLFGDQGPTHAAAMLVGSYAFLIFSHCNLRLSLGPLTSIVCGPQVHRVHHSRLPEHRDRNFAQYFPFLDRLFGTWHAPARDEFPPTGADGLASDAPIGAALVRPFRLWAGALGGAAKPAPARSDGH